MLTRAALFMAMIIAGLAFSGSASAHNVSKRDATFVQSNKGAAIAPFIYLGAKHMVTGYDHLAFLVGVIFFLYRLKDIVLYVSLFTIGHSTTLLAGVLGGIHANSYIIDAIIGLSVVYKAFDNMDGFKRLFGFEPNTKIAVLVFGLFHGFGLATKLQELHLSQNGLIANIVSFNVGVEIGQVLSADGGADRADLLAHAARIFPLRLRHQYGIDGGGTGSGGISAHRIFCRGINDRQKS